MTTSIHLFKGAHILIVEDEYFLAEETRRSLEGAGAIVVGPVSHVNDALLLLEQERVDAAILDVHLGDELVFPLVEGLEERKIPFVFATGHDPALIHAKYGGFALCEKSPELNKIAHALFGPGHDITLN